jgi:hypothetical protein
MASGNDRDVQPTRRQGPPVSGAASAKTSQENDYGIGPSLCAKTKLGSPDLEMPLQTLAMVGMEANATQGTCTTDDMGLTQKR